jgi:hypothetical protein
MPIAHNNPTTDSRHQKNIVTDCARGDGGPEILGKLCNLYNEQASAHEPTSGTI